MKPEARVIFEITSPTKKISLNYHLNARSSRNVHDVHDPITNELLFCDNF